MKYTLFLLAILAILQIAAAQVENVEEHLEGDIVDVEHFSGHGFGHHGFGGFHKFPHKKFHKKKKVCLKPTLTAHLIKVTKHYHCPWYKPFGFKIIIVFKTKHHTFTYVVSICSYKHAITLPKKIFKCALNLAVKKCKFIGLPKCITHKKHFIHRKVILGKCLVGVLEKCSKHGKVALH